MFLQTSLLYEKICLVPLEVIIEQVRSCNLLQVGRNLRTQKDLKKKKSFRHHTLEKVASHSPKTKFHIFKILENIFFIEYKALLPYK